MRAKAYQERERKRLEVSLQTSVSFATLFCSFVLQYFLVALRQFYFLVIERDYINLSRNISQVFTLMSWCGTFRQETRKAQVQFYLVNALGIIHVYSIIKEATQYQKLYVIPLLLELLSEDILLLLDCYVLLLLVRVVDQIRTYVYQRLAASSSTSAITLSTDLLRRNQATNIAITLNCCTRDYYCYEL